MEPRPGAFPPSSFKASRTGGERLDAARSSKVRHDLRSRSAIPVRLAPSVRPGANLFTTGIVALDASSGALRWSYQTEPNDDHDWDATGSAELDPANGTSVLAATSKDGLVHFVDLGSGKLLTKTATTTIANAAAPITPAGTHYCPGVTGGSEWNGAAWNPQTQLRYVNSVDWCVTVKLTKLASIKNITAAARAESGATAAAAASQYPTRSRRPMAGRQPLDPSTGGVRWHIKMATPMVALTPTAGGLVFTGDLNGNLLALDATGELLCRYVQRHRRGRHHLSCRRKAVRRRSCGNHVNSLPGKSPAGLRSLSSPYR